MLASRCFIGALVLLPLGFFLGGFFTHGCDPGIGVFLVPPGGLLLIAGLFLTARAALAQSKLGSSAARLCPKDRSAIRR